MFKRANELNCVTINSFFGGKGEALNTKILEAEQMLGKGRVFSHITLRPRSSVGWHQHNGDAECIYIISGDGIVNDNGTIHKVTTGDVVFTSDGESHLVENTGEANFEYIALVLYK